MLNLYTLIESLDCCSRNHPMCFCILRLYIIMREWVDDFTPFCENMHIQKYACCMKQDPVFLFLDNHESHCSLHTVFARQNGIVMVTFPLSFADCYRKWVDDANPGKKSVSMNSHVELCMHIHFHLPWRIFRLCLKILAFGHFQEMLLVMKVLQQHLLYVVDLMNPLF